jgi:hypothetical protein
VCQSCIDIDKRIDEYRQALRSTTDLTAIDRIRQTIAQLYADRVRFHQNPQA